MLSARKDSETTQLASASKYVLKATEPSPTRKQNSVLLSAHQDIFLTTPLAHVYPQSIAPAHSSAIPSIFSVSTAKTVRSVTSSTILFSYASKDAPLVNLLILTQEFVAHLVPGIRQLTSRLKTSLQDDACKNAPQTQGLSVTTSLNRVSMCVLIPILEAP
jgi:hypothetical protein